MSKHSISPSQSCNFAKMYLDNFSSDDEVYLGQKYVFWLKKNDEVDIYALANENNLSLPVARVLYNRGFRDKATISSYLFSSLERDVPHASLLKGADVAIERILHAIKSKEKILIFGDYDVDGITSVALMLSCLLPLCANINFFLPNRHDGYGLSSKVVASAKASGYSLIITVDNGISAINAAKTAQTLGVDLIITDHHRPKTILPSSVAIVDPNQDGCKYPTKGLCGVGVVFKLLEWIYEKKGKQLPENAHELLMLGTIADVSPLVGENRFWVRYGLNKINKSRSYAMQVLAANGKLLSKKRLSSLDIAFMIAPQLNALGRLSDPRDGVKFLISSNRDDIERVGKVLLELNEVRKEVERAVYEEICFAIESKKIDLAKENVIIASKKGWPSGVVGLVAGRLTNNYGKPSIIFREEDGGVLKGSCRSIKEFNIFDALEENKKLLLNFGGHSFAAGLSLKKENLMLLKENLEKKISDELKPFDLLHKIEIDSELELFEMNKRLTSDLEMLEPFGYCNEEPTFLIKDVILLQKPQLLKEKHVKCMIFSQGIIKPLIFFNRPELYQLIRKQGEKPFHVVGNVTTNEWNDRINIEFRGIDVVFQTA